MSAARVVVMTLCCVIVAISGAAVGAAYGPEGLALALPAVLGAGVFGVLMGDS